MRARVLAALVFSFLGGCGPGEAPGDSGPRQTLALSIQAVKLARYVDRDEAASSFATVSAAQRDEKTFEKSAAVPSLLEIAIVDERRRGAGADPLLYALSEADGLHAVLFPAGEEDPGKFLATQPLSLSPDAKLEGFSELPEDVLGGRSESDLMRMLHPWIARAAHLDGTFKLVRVEKLASAMVIDRRGGQIWVNAVLPYLVVARAQALSALAAALPLPLPGGSTARIAVAPSSTEVALESSEIARFRSSERIAAVGPSGVSDFGDVQPAAACVCGVGICTDCFVASGFTCVNTSCSVNVCSTPSCRNNFTCEQAGRRTTDPWSGPAFMVAPALVFFALRRRAA